MTSRVNGPITVAIVDDYDVVVMGLANMFDQYSDRVVVAELDSNKRRTDHDAYQIPHPGRRIGDRHPGVRGRVDNRLPGEPGC